MTEVQPHTGGGELSPRDICRDAPTARHAAGVVRVSSTDIETDVVLAKVSATVVTGASLSAVAHVATGQQHVDLLAPEASDHLVCPTCDRPMVDTSYRHACSYFRD